MPNTEYYNDKVVRQFLLAAAVWGIIGMSIGVYIAAELMWPALNFDIPFLTFSRLRPDHTFGVIFAFGGSALMGTCYYVVQRTGQRGWRSRGWPGSRSGVGNWSAYWP